jgi:putative hydrolase of the HAD superfamily
MLTLSDQRKITTILFDAGDTLVYPRSGHWYITPNFYHLLERYGVAPSPRSVLETALLSAHSYLDNRHSIQTEEEEAQQFREYYSLVFKSLYDSPVPDDLIRDLSNDMVFNDDKFVFFKDSLECVNRLHRNGYKLGILSNTWPSLERVFRNAGYREFFDVFVISSQVGCFKPSLRIYHTAIKQSGSRPEHILFVDDSESNLAGGAEAGLVPVRISRYGRCNTSPYHCIEYLTDFEKDLGPLLAGENR